MNSLKAVKNGPKQSPAQKTFVICTGLYLYLYLYHFIPTSHLDIYNSRHVPCHSRVFLSFPRRRESSHSKFNHSIFKLFANAVRIHCKFFKL